MKSLSLLTLMMLSFFAALAQSGGQDIVHLKNGSEIHGVLLEPDSLGRLRIEILGGSVFVYTPEEVLKIEKQDPSKAAAAPVTRYGFSTPAAPIKPKPPVQLPEAGQMYYAFDFTLRPMGKFSMGKRITSSLDVGGGVGTSMQLAKLEAAPFLMQVFAEGKYRFLPGRSTTPFVYAAAGYNQPLFRNMTLDDQVGIIRGSGSIAKGGLYADLAFGFQFFTRSPYSITLSAGWKYHRSSRDVLQWTWGWEGNTMLVSQRTTLRNPSLSLGFCF